MEQLSVSFKIYVDFECNLKGVKSNDKNKSTSYTEQYQAHIPCSFAYNIVCIGYSFTKLVILYRKYMHLINSLKQFLRSMGIAKKIITKYFNKNLVMYAEKMLDM